VVMRVPLHAYAPAAYYASHDSESLWLSLFYGALLMAAAYHFCVAALVRRVEYARYGLAALSFALVLICLNGQQAQFWFRNAPVLSERLVPVSLALSLWVTFLFIRDVIARVPGLPFDGGLYTATRRARSLLVVFSAIAPVGLSIRVVAAVLFLVSVVAVPAILYKLSQTAPAELDLYRRSWWALGLPIPIALLRFADLLPAGILDWALPAGFTLHGLAISLALPLWVSGMERRLAVVNAKLESNVQELSQALANAEEANLEAVRATKAKDDFMATMSHELRTPLNAIINIPQGLVSEFEVLPSARCAACETSFLLDDDERIGADTLCPECGAVGRLEAGTKVTFRGDDARCLRFLQKIERSGQHLLQMVNGVLDYSKLEAGRFELVLGTVALEALVREACDHMVDIAQRKGITLEVVPPEVAVTLAADELRLKQVMINLLANAIKFSEPGTAVTIRWQSSGVATQIEVEDRGIGIAPEYHERVFASFEQVHQGDTRKYGGTGLGLSISRSLVRMHGGELSVRSEPGKGSTFVVHLPRIHLSMHPANMATDSMAS